FALGSTFLGTAAILWGIRSRSASNETALDRVAHAFKQALPDLEMSFDPQDILSHSTDVSSNLPQSKPHMIVYPTSEDEVSQILKVCNKLKIPVVAYGAGTSLEGQIVPGPRSGVVVDLSRMSAIVKIYPEASGFSGSTRALDKLCLRIKDMQAVVQAGLGATVGGMCATGCSGTRAYRYGVMRDNVIGLRAVLPDGRIVKTRRRPNKSSAGYDLTRLFIGSEGTLGIITEVTVKLRNIPENLGVALIAFDELTTAGEMVQDLFRTGIQFHRLELMDKTAMEA
ncbi:hypothetical protein HDU93_005613, partial [Gonapodya sp. JEL0774]